MSDQPDQPDLSGASGGFHTPAYGSVDLNNCDREPIHVPGAIQPHGVLLATDAEGRRVTMASENAGELLGGSIEQVLGADLAEVLGARVAAAVRTAFDGPGGDTLRLSLPETPGGSALAGGPVDVNIHRSGERWVVELEPGLDVAVAMPSYRLARGAMQRLARTETVLDLTGRLAEEVAALTGFDRVMVYRFDQDWNGEVVAERRRPDLNAFLGLHYPATDIPAQARRLYTVNWTRLIADVQYRPVALTPVLDPATAAPLDLSHSVLRSVSPIHLEYLANMGVTASMSVSLVVDGRLWGLIACHHYSGPHRPGHDVRAASEFLGQSASQLIAERQRADTRAARAATDRRLAGVMARTTASGTATLQGLLDDPELLDLMDAGGAVLCFDGVVSTRGAVPDEDSVRRIVELLRRDDNQARASAHLAALDPALAPVRETAAGALVMGSAPDRWLVWLRPELRQIVDWGGDPSNKLLAQAEDSGVRLSPRKSFEKWQQVVQGRSARWAAWHTEAAETLSAHVASLLYLHSREQIDMAESLQRSVILAEAPRLPGLDTVARYLPASTFQLGGDWWDAFPLGAGRYAFVVGDVAGHGVAAATTMTQVRSALRAHLVAGESPAAALDRTDRFMDSLHEQLIATVVAGTVEPATGRVVLAAAGHPPPYLFAGSYAEELRVGTRPLLGLGVESGQQTELVLAPGATLMLYTDGLVERRGESLTDSLARLGTLSAPEPGREQFERWADQVLRVAPGRRDDDTTLLAFRLADDA